MRGDHMMNENTRRKLKQSYAGLLSDKKTFFLSILALELTVSARGAYPSQELKVEKDSLTRLICLNEIQHTVTGHLAKMINKDDERYPDDVFFEIMFEKASSGPCEKDLLTALKFSFKQLGISLDDVLFTT
jgi:hypothetical protein